MLGLDNGTTLSGEDVLVWEQFSAVTQATVLGLGCCHTIVLCNQTANLLQQAKPWQSDMPQHPQQDGPGSVVKAFTGLVDDMNHF